MPTFRIVTINILKSLTHWRERRGLLVEGLAAAQPDLIALQEVNLAANNAHWLADQLGGYAVMQHPRLGAQRDKEGVAILSRLPVEQADWLDLRSQGRVAQCVHVRVDGRPVVVANGHFFWRPGEARERVAQVRLLLDWLPGACRAPIVVCGDLNATPAMPTYRLMCERFVSAHVAQHGHEPPFTCPTPLVYKTVLPSFWVYALTVFYTGRLRPWRGTLDYVFVNEGLSVLDCQVVLNKAAPHDPLLYPSDHFGLAATLRVNSK